MKKNSLPVENTLLPIVCIGIASNEKDYRLCHFLNKEFDLNLSKNKEKFRVQNKGQATEIPYFYFEDAYSAFYLFENKIKSKLLLTEYKTISYWFTIKFKTANPRILNLTTRLNRMDIVITSFELKKQKDIQFINDLIIQ